MHERNRSEIENSSELEVGNRINELAQRVNHPLVHLFNYYATDGMQSEKSAKDMWKSTCLSYIPQSHYFYPYGDMLESYSDEYEYLSDVDLTHEESEAVYAVFDKHNEKRNAFINDITVNSLPILEMFDTMKNIAGDRKPLDEEPRLCTYPEANMMASNDMIKKYGFEFDKLITENPNVRKDYTGRIEYYLNQQMYHKPNKNNKIDTVEDACHLLENTLKQQYKTTLKDLTRAGCSLYVVTENSDTPQNNKFISPAFRLKEEDAEKLWIKTSEIKPDKFNRLRKSFIVNLGENEVTILNSVYYTEYKKRSLLNKIKKPFSKISNKQGNGEIYTYYLDFILGEKINKSNTLSNEQLRSYTELEIRLNLMEVLQNTFNDLANYKTSDRLMDPKIEEGLEPIRDVIENIDTNPAILLATYKSLFISYKNRNVLREVNILDYVTWQNLFQAGNRQPFPEFPNKQKKEKLSIDSLFAELLNLNIVKTKARDVLSHNNAEVNPQLSSRSEVFNNILNKYLNPDFILTWDCKDEDIKLDDFAELSTYPKNEKLPFEPFDMAPQEKQSIVKIRSTVASGVGKDIDGKSAVNIYTPEFALISSIKVKSTKGELLFSEDDYVLEYESKTGHYRIVLTKNGEKKLNPLDLAVNYLVTLDAVNKNNNPEEVGGVVISDVGVIGQYADYFRDHGFTKIADNLNKLIKNASKGRGVFTNEVSDAIKKGSLYAFSEVSANALKKNKFIPYLPEPDSKGRALVQCRHSAQLLKDIFKYSVNEGYFYSATMVTSALIGPGIAFAGALHADTRGRVGEFKLRHDATPSLNIGALLNYFKTRDGNSEIKQRKLDEASLLYNDFKNNVLRKNSDNGSNNKIDLSYKFPAALVQLANLLYEIQDNTFEITDNSDERHELLQKLVKNRELWMMSDTEMIGVNKKGAYKELFGNGDLYNSIAISSVNRAIDVLKAI